MTLNRFDEYETVFNRNDTLQNCIDYTQVNTDQTEVAINYTHFNAVTSGNLLAINCRAL